MTTEGGKDRVVMVEWLCTCIHVHLYSVHEQFSCSDY